MSQLDISIFYNHLFGLLLILYIFAHFVTNIIYVYTYNETVRYISEDITLLSSHSTNSLAILTNLLD